MLIMTLYTRHRLQFMLAVGIVFLALVSPAMAETKADVRAFTLSEQDAKNYRRLFTLNVRGDVAGAKALSRQVNDKTLLNWAGIGGKPPAAVWQGLEGERLEYTSPLPRDANAVKAVELVKSRVDAHIRADKLDWAEDTLAEAIKNQTLDRIESAQIRAKIASYYLYNNEPRVALKLAHYALQVGGKRVPQAGWIAGLASWKLEQYGAAARYFAWVPRSDYAGPWMKSAAAYWTARSLGRAGHYAQVSAWLMEAAKHPRSFYGLIATRALGSRFDFEWDVDDFNTQHAAILKKHPEAVRALKLAQAGQMDMAQAELSLIDAASHSKLRQALAALAVAALPPDSAMQVASMLQTPMGGTMDVALYPLMPWQPKDGYKVDPALLTAFVRQESRFKPAAQNKGSGAAGLMQLMPRTAKSLGGGNVKSPEASLSLGQAYLEDLLDMTNGDLFDTAIAYNAGPGKLREWKDRFAEVDDPLLFIEIIPYGETRAYVERVMANYWIYSLRLGQVASSLEAVAAGQIAQYAPASNKSGDMLALGAQ